MSRIIAAALMLLSTAAQAAHLSDAEEARLRHLVEQHRTADGATVTDVLRHAATLRPRAFKPAEVVVVYDSEKNLSGVRVCYFLGNKRLKDDDICDVSYGVSADRKSVSPILSGTGLPDTAQAMEGGRDAFLRAIDAAYEEACIDADTHRRSC